jgi:hypothetical protein
MASLYGKIPFTEHKFWEIEGIYDKKFTNWVNFLFRVNRKTDHAGLEISFDVIGFLASFRIYDCRHWDWDKNNWVTGGSDD